MRKRNLIGLGVSILAGVCFAGSYALSQDKDKAPAAPGGMDQAAMEKAYMEAGKPGPHHKALEAMAGDFKYTIKYKMDPSQDWQSSAGEYHGDMGLGGRYLLHNVKGDMGPMGTFEGMGVIGYDNTINKFVAGWIDNMGTGVMRAEGTSSDDKTITFEGKMMDPAMKKLMPYQFTYEIKSNDAFTMRWSSPSMSDGKMFESMVIEYTRTK